METLVLSNGYEPIRRVPWTRAMTLFWNDKVEVLNEHDKIVHPGLGLRAPSVVRFLNNTRSRKRSIKFSKENVFARDKGTCQYCCQKIEKSKATYDHVRPRKLGGKTDWNNIVISCAGCNQRKGGRTCEQARMFPKMAPIKPRSLPSIIKELQWENTMPEHWYDYLKVYSI